MSKEDGFENIKLKSLIEIAKKDGIYLQVTKNFNFKKIKIKEGVMYRYHERSYRGSEGWGECSQVTVNPNARRYCDPADFSIYINEQIKDMAKDDESPECIDCGCETKKGTGSARCPECWDERCGKNKDLK